jgi:hypothetical protein
VGNVLGNEIRRPNPKEECTKYPKGESILTLKIGTKVGGYFGGGVNGGDEGKKIWLMSSVYIYEIEL